MNKSIFKRFIEGDEEAFGLVYQEFYPLIKQICYFYTRIIFLSEDLAMQTFTNVWERRTNIRDYKALKKYLTTTAKNLCIDYSRKKTRNQVDVVDPFTLDTIVIPKEEKKDINERLQKIAKILDEESYQMIVYKYVYDLKHREIAEIMNVTTAAVSNKINRALKKIKSELK